MKTVLIGTFCLTLLLLTSVNSTDQTLRTLQSTTRSTAVGKFCAVGVDRTTLVTEQAKTDAKTNSDSMKSSFPMSGNQLIGTILADKNNILANVVAQLPNIGTQIGIFAGPFVIGFVITFIIWPFLCCCCCCPSCCPSKCCQKNETQQYTKCELIWPSIVLVLALLLMIIGSVIGITRAGDIENTYKTVGCAAAITIDDVINGNTSSTGTYFLGVQGLSNSLNQLKGQLNTVDSNLNQISFANAGGVLKGTYNTGSTLVTDISLVPTNTAGGSLTFNYPNHFDGTVVAGGISSSIPTILGSADVDPAPKNGAVGGAYTAVNLINEGIKSIGVNADNFKGQVVPLAGIIDSIVEKMGSISTPISSADTTVAGLDDQVTPIMKIVTIVVTAIFGTFIGLGVLSIIGTLLMTFCDKFSCRYLIYFVCVILLILGILSFLLASLFSIITPILYLGCDFLTVSLSSSTNFNTNVGKILDPSVTNYLAVCLPGGSGDIINQLGVDLTGINGLTNSVSSMRSFSPSQLQNGVQQAITTLQTSFDQYYYGDILDFNSNSDETLLRNLLNVGSYAGCSAGNFMSDRWVPSIRSSSIPCTVSTAQCPTTASVATPAGTNCTGCIDTTKVLFDVYLGASPSANLATRYSDCASWRTDFGNIFTNYYSVKWSGLNNVKDRITDLSTSFNTPTTGYKAKIASLGTTFSNTITSLEGIVSSVVDPRYGLIAGLNCLLLGDDLNLVINSTCTSFFNTFYFLRFSLGVAAFGILFTLCCTTCSGVRAYKHMSRKGSILPKDGMNQQSTMAALNNKY